MIRAATLTLNPCLDRTMYFQNRFEAGALNRASQTVLTLGGKGINVSRFFKILGVDAPAYGFSGGSNGDIMKKLLFEEGVECCFTESMADTRMNIKMIDQSEVCTEANEKGGPISDLELKKLLSDLENAVEKDKYFFLGGSIPHPVDNSVYNFITQMLKDKGAKVILDCDGEALKKGIEAGPSLIKPNLFELSGLVGKKVETVEDALSECKRLYVEKGVEILCTMSEKGAIFAGECGLFSVTSPRVELRGFTGAGDSFLTAFIYERERTGSVAEALKFASSAAGAKVELPGSTLPTLDEMKKYISCVEICRY
ncbi:MAG: 1-phosphofructokinase family hexose kinase [Ruminococcaceae bacterium]|nr:1-phosphofructokinase family hexose kinase [Oscillospiraceae bacterium]